MLKTVFAFVLGAFVGASYPAITKYYFQQAGQYAKDKIPAASEKAVELKDSAEKMAVDEIKQQTHKIIQSK